MNLCIQLAENGLIRGNFNEFNLMIDNKANVTLIFLRCYLYTTKIPNSAPTGMFNAFRSTLSGSTTCFLKISQLCIMTFRERKTSSTLRKKKIRLLSLFKSQTNKTRKRLRVKIVMKIQKLKEKMRRRKFKKKRARECSCSRRIRRTSCSRCPSKKFNTGKRYTT
ncbi:unnamed protein product [Moneuplotes crassus]|uniref:Uncharacterized protein n=1 Tax=Euplotes crassus TaxID=5936 RepID=A0AAD1XZ51_EUPCR|nr:unnamed protein product [Moneuplotes crassus]